MEYQHTIKATVEILGIGIHSGEKVKLRLLPANERTGIRFKRVDLPDMPEVKAVVANVVNTDRSTTIQKGAAKVQTIEHLMAALYFLGLDNLLIEIDNVEVPILDGSAIEFIDKIQEVGLLKQQEERTVIYLDENINFNTGNGNSEIEVTPSDDFRVSVNIAYNNEVINNQYAELKTLENFKSEIASARTFCCLSELDMLVQHDLIKGGSLNNALVFKDVVLPDEKIDRLKKYFDIEAFDSMQRSVLNGELRFKNEAARHKLLDFIGDLALVGNRVKARIHVNCPGHSVNTSFAKFLVEYIKKKKNQLLIPKLNFNEPPVLDIHQIEKMLPHRYPFLLVDRILKLTDDEVIGMKNLTYNEAFFQGHFPDNAIMPGVLQIEAMAQTGGILALSTVEDPENYWTYFLRIEQARFRQPVKPGDTAIFQLKLLKPIRRGIVEMKAYTFVNNQIATEAILMAQIVKKGK